MKKIKDFVIYHNDMFHSAFPSVIQRSDGEIICAFRRAPMQSFLYGVPGYEHTDPNSCLVKVRSSDGGETWTKEPELIFAHPLGGSQDPCMYQLSDGSIICASYGWALVSPEATINLDNIITHGRYAFLGGYILRSEDGGKTWLGPFIPPSLSKDGTLNALKQPCPTYNRGQMLQLADGALLWAVVANRGKKPRHACIQLVSSSDRGETWTYICPIAEDDTVQFNETSLVQTINGDIIAFMRTADFDGKMAYARSTDGGKSFEPWKEAWYGFPLQATRLKDGRVFLVYGYRHEPYGIRARLLNPDCTDVIEAPEFIIRSDGGMGDLGYPWAIQFPDGRILVVYYFNIGGGTRHIAGSLLEVTGE